LGLDRLREERTQIHIEGILLPENIDCLYSPNRIEFRENEKSFIEREWEKEVKRDPKTFDGKLFHVKSHSFSQSGLVLDTCKSSFKEWLGTKNRSFKDVLGVSENRIIRPLSIGSMIVTADNKWVIGRRVKAHGFIGQYAVVGGYMDPDNDLLNSKPDPFFAVKREIEEETGIDKKWDIDNVICLGLNDIDQPYLAFNAHLKISYEELISKIPEERELGRLEAYDYEKQIIRNFVLSNYKDLTPHTLANMLMSHKLLTRS
jgi:8-oxo-dGTP pyrophosphatase MutT (NUDIX family)